MLPEHNTVHMMCHKRWIQIASRHESYTVDSNYKTKLSVLSLKLNSHGNTQLLQWRGSVAVSSINWKHAFMLSKHTKY